MKGALLISLALGAAIGVSSCVAHYVPDARIETPAEIPHIAARGGVALINAQPSTESVLIGEVGMGRSVRGNLHAWTDQAIEALTDTLKERGVTVADHSAKSLKISITAATIRESAGGFAFTCTIQFTVETGTGKVFSLVAENGSWQFLRSCDDALGRMVLVLLQERDILDYLASV